MPLYKNAQRGMVRRIDTRAMARLIFTTLFPLYDSYSYGEREREVKIIRVLRGTIISTWYDRESSV